MSVLLRKTNGPNRPEAVFTDQSIELSTIKVGSSVSADLQLISGAVAPTHCEIKTRGNTAKLKCGRGHNIVYNGEQRTSATITSGDVIEVGGYRIESIHPPSGFDLALKVSRERRKPINYENLYKTDLTQTRISPRLITWTLATIVLMVALIAPLASYVNSTKISDETTSTQSFLGLTDSAWSSGPLHAAHSALENNCSACHQKLFQKVTTESCTTCHQDTSDHIAAVAENPNLPITANDRCATCHREHNEPQSTLIVTVDSLCTDCHQQHNINTAEALTLDAVTGFGKELHAGFAVSLLKQSEENRYNPEAEWTVEKTDVASAVDESQLSFNHEVHSGQQHAAQDPDVSIQILNVIKANGGDALTCTDCHALEPAGEHFAAISFEQNCANSGCHDLELDKRTSVPHALPGAAIATIQGYYLRQVGDSVQNFNTVAENCRRRPGKNNCEEKCTGTAYECASNKAAQTVEQHFSRTGCVTCHLVDTDNNANLLDRYRIPTVKLTDDFYPQAAFDHSSHNVMIVPNTQTSYTGDGACTYCHNAPVSSDSKDVLMPDIDNCVTCHEANSSVVSNVPLQCVDCHRYHLTQKLLVLSRYKVGKRKNEWELPISYSLYRPDVVDRMQ